jgi:cobalt/nickel transport system permease protein
MSSVQATAKRKPGRRPDTLERTLADLNNSLEQSLFAEQMIHRPGYFQTLDARIKILTTLAVLLAIGLSRNLAVILGLYVLIVVFAWLSAVPVKFFVWRVWMFIPFFTALIAIPAIFMTPGPKLVTLFMGLAITRTGLMTAMFLILRVAASVSMAVLLILTTPWNTTLKALGVLRIPDVVVVMIGMTYRYIHLLLQLAGDLFLARKSRMVGRLSGKTSRDLVTSSMGVLLSKSLDLSSEVYLAMQSRGLRGYPRTMDSFQMRTRDWIFAGGSALICGLAIWLGR